MPYHLAQQYVAELVTIFEYLKEKAIAHRDLKPENCLLDESMHIKLTDFGAAKRCIVPTASDQQKAQRRGTLVGTREYDGISTWLAMWRLRCC